jgi:hypothetical protein
MSSNVATKEKTRISGAETFQLENNSNVHSSGSDSWYSGSNRSRVSESAANVSSPTSFRLSQSEEDETSSSRLESSISGPKIDQPTTNRIETGKDNLNFIPGAPSWNDTVDSTSVQHWNGSGIVVGLQNAQDMAEHSHKSDLKIDMKESSDTNIHLMPPREIPRSVYPIYVYLFYSRPYYPGERWLNIQIYSLIFGGVLGLILGVLQLFDLNLFGVVRLQSICPQLMSLSASIYCLLHLRWKADDKDFKQEIRKFWIRVVSAVIVASDRAQNAWWITFLCVILGLLVVIIIDFIQRYGNSLADLLRDNLFLISGGVFVGELLWIILHSMN